MAAILTVSSSLSCTHSNPIPATTASNQKLTVSGALALLTIDATAWIPGCTAGQAKCTKVVGVTVAGQSKLTVSGTPVCAVGLTGTTDKGPISAVANQTKLTSV